MQCFPHTSWVGRPPGLHSALCLWVCAPVCTNTSVCECLCMPDFCVILGRFLFPGIKKLKCEIGRLSISCIVGGLLLAKKDQPRTFFFQFWEYFKSKKYSILLAKTQRQLTDDYKNTKKILHLKLELKVETRVACLPASKILVMIGTLANIDISKRSTK